jgi:hypothetical protein
VALHDLEELGDDLGGRADHDLALAGLLGVVDVLKSIVENGSLDHFGGWGWRFSNRETEVRYLPDEWYVSLPRPLSMESALFGSSKRVLPAQS